MKAVAGAFFVECYICARLASITPLVLCMGVSLFQDQTPRTRRNIYIHMYWVLDEVFTVLIETMI